MHNVRTDQLSETADKARSDPTAAKLAVSLKGAWNIDESAPQFAGGVKFPDGEITFTADFPPFLGGGGRAPTPLAYCFYGAMCCYGATFATQAAMAGVDVRSLIVGLTLTVDFRTALGLGQFPPMDKFIFTVQVQTDATDEDIQKVKSLADERCPAIWAMSNSVPYETTVIRGG
jgi:uncharacterized OsmC-like protein